MTKIIKRNDAQKKAEFSSKSTHSNIMPIETGGVLNKKTLDAKDKAQSIINEALSEADRVRSEAKELYDRIAAEKEKAKKDGYELGRSEGLASATEQIVSLAHIREKFYSTAEPEMIKLVMNIAEKVIGKMVREHEGAIKSIVRQAVESSLGERITVRLNPEDYKIVTSDEFEFKDIFDRNKRIVFKEDDTINKGGCVVETEVGTIDARLETQLKAIKKALEL